MENYTKGKTVEEPLDRDRIPIPNLPENFLWMQVKGGSKMPRLLEHASGVFDTDETKAVVWTGSGDGVIRAVACAEAMKRHRKIEHQITKIGYRRCDEFWEPQTEGLERLIVNREIPIIHILQSNDPVNTAEPGYQSFSCNNAFWQTNSNQKKKPYKKQPKVTPEEIAAMGLQTNSTKGKKNSFRFNSKKKSPTDKS